MKRCYASKKKLLKNIFKKDLTWIGNILVEDLDPGIERPGATPLNINIFFKNTRNILRNDDLFFFNLNPSIICTL